MEIKCKFKIQEHVKTKLGAKELIVTGLLIDSNGFKYVLTDKDLNTKYCNEFEIDSITKNAELGFKVSIKYDK